VRGALARFIFVEQESRMEVPLVPLELWGGIRVECSAAASVVKVWVSLTGVCDGVQ